ncbi:hypothetical protein, unknown function [Leishmania mexicana MHOM/GT/2001/U1103]|uniref:Uncharacterized protein n=1 Tax=Leishmania mexicana (strain MHOM/GT/2001/U1103) TaxID=929439 RepID=E9AKX8_LEIMU|nr:hypothetical protein, unknown function [Leishmania mexicana MHOM/GT/2001/U1103]CBZ23581.1 hypothetical protein, unknown function [Leishmania mexicana MHOM/GT/2001/U1103]
MHYTTSLAVAAPLAAIALCVCAGVKDGSAHSLFFAASTFFSGVVMWLRSRYIATLYLNELQARRQHFTDSLRQRFGDGGAAAAARGASAQHDDGRAAEAYAAPPPVSRPPRTVARVSPVLPAFLACCLLLISILSTISAALHAIWYVRSLEVEQA